MLCPTTIGRFVPIGDIDHSAIIRAFDFRTVDRAERMNNLLRPLTLSDKS
jgi:hypothetical protein